MSASSPAPKRWLFGPALDLLLGCGLLYVILFASAAAAGARLRASQPDLLFPLLVIALSAPHYGATLLRVYEQRSSRRAYAIFAVHATLVVFAWFAAAAHVPLLAAWMVTLYFTWSPWHYTGQNYGLAVMFLRRRGVEPSPRVRRCLYASFLLSYLVVFLMMHAASSTAVDRPLAVYGSGIDFVPLGIPRAAVDAAVPVALAAYAVTLIGSAGLLLRRAPARDLVPTAVLVLVQALWFTIPFAVHHWRLHPGIEPVEWDLRSLYLPWIVAGHAIQYLWVTTYYARASEGWRGVLPYLTKTLVAGVAIWTLPAVLFAPRLLGSHGFHAGLALLVAAAVNIHHFVLDGAIWKLRQHRVARVLIRSERDAPSPGPTELAPAALGRRAVWGVAAVGCALGFFFFWEESVALPHALERRDLDGAIAVQQRLGWFGRSHFVLVKQLLRAQAQRDDLRPASTREPPPSRPPAFEP